jgi:predicted DNA binding CopG/RHH family protein
MGYLKEFTTDLKDNYMLKHYDFSKSIKNPCSKKLKKQITIRVENDTIDYFKKVAAETDIPYQKLINLFLPDCAAHHKSPELNWKPNRRKAA